ncbi:MULTISPECIES: hypothetical protein [unclassified Streptosporangium]|uniref:hypothetical protein n=1 Tax=Streptosporangium sp. NPDC005286 TaxID=3154463 RepID=UPI0033AA0782
MSTMSNRILQTIAVGATSVVLIGGLAGMAGATPTNPEAVAGSPSHNATAAPSPTKSCQKDKSCKKGYAVGYKAGERSCKSGVSSKTPSGSAEYKRGFELGYKHARARHC